MNKNNNINIYRELEEEIVRKFVLKECRSRILYELFSKKKRDNGIGNLEYKFDYRHVIDVTGSDIVRIFVNYGAKLDDDMYVMNDSEIFKLEKAIEICGSTCRGFAYWISGGIGYYSGEMWSTRKHGAAAPQYILKRSF